ncbi:MAG: FHA domain-containing protein [Clostridiaceae bacterium]|jgi:hypothetical protein|nr:FHA domain-containing protein [Clostridiaceae bacterium]
MEQTRNGLIRITCPGTTPLDEDQSACLLRRKPNQLLSLWIRQDNELEFILNSNGLIPLSQLKGRINPGQSLQYLKQIAQAAYIATDHLLTIDLRLLVPDLIMVNVVASHLIKLISLPIPEQADLSIRIGNSDPLSLKHCNLVRWLAVENSWPPELTQELDRLFQDQRWAELIKYLSIIISREKSALAQSAAQESLILSTTNTAAVEIRPGIKEAIKTRVRSLKKKCQKKSKSSHWGETKIMSKHLSNNEPTNQGYQLKLVNSLKRLGQWLGLLKDSTPMSELLDLEPTENLPNRTPNYRLAILCEGLPGTPMADDGQKAFILVDEFIIGRDSKRVDLFLDSPAVGRRHARIMRRGENFFVEDLGSLNNTLLDGIRLEKYRETLLPDRCRLTFADRSFYFSTD